MKHTTAIFSILAACAMLAGCSSPVNIPTAPGKSGVFIVGNDPQLGRDLVVTHTPIATGADSRHMKAQADLFNAGTHELHVQYKFVWFNAAGEVLHADMRTWQPQTLRPGETAQLTAVCTSPGAATYRVDIDRQR